MNSGKCHGGPLDGQMMHYPTSEHRIAINPYPGRGPRTIPGMIASSDPEIKFGTYHFFDGTWTWHESPPSAPPNPVHNENR